MRNCIYLTELAGGLNSLRSVHSISLHRYHLVPSILRLLHKLVIVPREHHCWTTSLYTRTQYEIELGVDSKMVNEDTVKDQLTNNTVCTQQNNTTRSIRTYTYTCNNHPNDTNRFLFGQRCTVFCDN